MHKPSLWAVVLNSETARILCGIHKDGHADAAEIKRHNPHQRLQDVMADKPGRSFASVGSRRSGMEYSSDPLRDAQRAFVRKVLQHLDKARTDDGFDELAGNSPRRAVKSTLRRACTSARPFR